MRPFRRFAAKVVISTSLSGCWEWTGSISGGYGRFRPGASRPTASAHRWAYEQFVGPVPAGLDLDHLCRNPRCVNPMHLEPVTRRENLRRSPFSPGHRTHCPQGHPYEGGNVYLYTDRLGRKHRHCMTCLRLRSRCQQQKLRLAA